MSELIKKKKLSSRTRSRRLAMQALYQWLVSGEDLVDAIETQFTEDQEMQSANQKYFSELLYGVANQQDELLTLLAPHVSRPLAEIDPIEKAVLLIAAYELKHVLSVPYRAVINEAIELTKVYGAEAAHKFINGALDKLAAELRTTEKNAD